ncbi:hypothetical protein PHLCEN_2v12599 [Hermanssonia centrifuga]|uniref:Uncharacterized protein n=1 Tax=Hermanssonia centrifuga TaxID=98765 RepID=A0A2R6NGN2_9APHY|nr:hypothetical protein PHLCEN_2v12599 [Hermanssonia centrifuga]
MPAFVSQQQASGSGHDTTDQPNSHMYTDDPLGVDKPAGPSESTTSSWTDNNPNTADNDNPVDSVRQLDNIKIEYHPKARIPTKIYRFADYGRDCNTAPATTFANDPWLPGFNNRLDFEFAELTLECAMNQKQIDKLLGIVRRIANDPSQFSFNKYDDIKGAWDIAGEVHPPDKLPDGATPYALYLFADKTKLSSFGSQKGYPIVCRTPQLDINIHYGKGLGVGRVVGLLPIIEEELQNTKTPSFINWKHVVWHKLFAKVLKLLEQLAKTGWRTKCGDGILRWLFPLLLILSADYEEQCFMALIRGLGGLCPCPVCLVPKEKLKFVVEKWPLRVSKQGYDIMTNKLLSKKAREQKLKELSLRPVMGGLFGQHLFKEFKAQVEELGRVATAQVDTQFASASHWSGLNHFDAVMHVDFSDGTKFGDIFKILQKKVMIHPEEAIVEEEKIMYEKEEEEIVMDEDNEVLAVNEDEEMNDPEDDEVEAEMEIDVNEVEEEPRHEQDRSSDGFGSPRKKQKIKNWNFIKIHSHVHAADDIRAKGVSRNYNTKPNEKSHGRLKDAYQRTNFKNIEGQISKIDHQFLCAEVIRERIDAWDEFCKGGNSDDSETHHIFLVIFGLVASNHRSHSESWPQRTMATSPSKGSTYN